MISSVSWVSSSTAALLVAVNGTSTAARGSHRRGRNLIRVLEATVKGPQRGSQRPTSPRPHTDQGATTSAGDQPDFHPGTGLPAGRSETSPNPVAADEAAWVPGGHAGRLSPRGYAVFQQQVPFVGRDADLRLFEFVLGPGEAGTGKTRLCQELSRSHRGRGGQVLLGRASPDEAAISFGAIADALRTARRGEPPLWHAALARPSVLWTIAPSWQRRARWSGGPSTIRCCSRRCWTRWTRPPVTA